MALQSIARGCFPKHHRPHTGDAATMPRPALAPLAEMPMPPHIAALPKADIHIHQEWSPWLDQVLAQWEGRAAHAGYHPHLLDLVARRGVTVECALTCNVVLGAASSYAAHPLRRFVAAGIPVALCTDDPVQMGTTIGREYAIAHALGFATDDLLGFTRNAVRAAFIAPPQRTALLAEVDTWDRAHRT